MPATPFIARLGLLIIPAVLPVSPVAGQLAIDSGASNTLKVYNGTSWVSAAPSTPGGSSTTIQYNASGAFAGDDGFVYDSVNHRLGIRAGGSGVFAPQSTIHATRNSNTGVRLDTHSSTPTATAALQMYRSRGTEVAPTAVQSGDIMGMVSVFGYGASAFSSVSRANLVFTATQNWTDAAQGTQAAINVTATGGTTTAQSVAFDSLGLIVGTADPTAPSTARNLRVQGRAQVGSYIANGSPYGNLGSSGVDARLAAYESDGANNSVTAFVGVCEGTGNTALKTGVVGVGRRSTVSASRHAGMWGMIDNANAGSDFTLAIGVIGSDTTSAADADLPTGRSVGVFGRAIQTAQTTLPNCALYATASGSSAGNWALFAASGVVSILDTTVSGNTNQGALVVAGGVGVGGSLFAGATLNNVQDCNFATDSTARGVYIGAGNIGSILVVGASAAPSYSPSDISYPGGVPTVFRIAATETNNTSSAVRGGIFSSVLHSAGGIAQSAYGATFYASRTGSSGAGEADIAVGVHAAAVRSGSTLTGRSIAVNAYARSQSANANSNSGAWAIRAVAEGASTTIGTAIGVYGEASGAALNIAGRFVGAVRISGQVTTSGAPAPTLAVLGSAVTALTASTEFRDVSIELARTMQFATGALVTQRSVVITPPTIAFVGASTVTKAVTFSITGAPIAGTNATISTSYAFEVEAGTSNFVGRVLIADSTASTSSTSGALVVSGGVGVGGEICSLRSITATSGTTFSNRFATVLSPASASTAQHFGTRVQCTIAEGVGNISSAINSAFSVYAENNRSTTVAALDGAIMTAQATSTSGTTSSLRALHLVVSCVNSGHTVTTATALSIENTALLPGTITNRYAIDQKGSNDFVRFAGLTRINNSTASTTTSTGALTVLGGVGVGGVVNSVGLSSGSTSTATLGVVYSNAFTLTVDPTSTSNCIFASTYTSTDISNGASTNVQLPVYGSNISVSNQRAVGTVSELVGLNIGASTTAVSGTTTELTGISVGLADASGGHTVTTGTALEIRASVGNITNKYAITQLGANDRNYFAGAIVVANSTVSTSTMTGALTVAGGVGIGGDLYVGGRTGTAVTVAGFDSSGKLVEFTLTPAASIYFAARTSSTQALTGSTTNIIYGTVDNSAGGGYDSSTGVFTAPATGTYQFNWAMTQASNFAAARLYVNGTARDSSSNQSGTSVTCAGSTVIRLTLGDTVSIRSTSTGSLASSSDGNRFSGVLIG